MSKTIIAIIVIIIVTGLGYWVYQSTLAPEGEVASEGSKDCVNGDDCVVFGETGDCNCGCYNKDNLPSGTGGECFCAAPTSCKCANGKCEGVFGGEINNFDECVDAGYAIIPPTPGGYTECRTPDGRVFYLEEINVSLCARDGEVFSRVSDEYFDSCCEGLKEWIPIPDTRFSIADVCYEIGPPSESNIGLCIKCGDGVCENHLNYDENPCNCPEDCAGKNKSHFSSIEEFCQSNDWKMSLSKACEEQEPIKGSPICELCAF